MRAFIDCFSSGLDELPRKKQRDKKAVLLHLSKAEQFSIFEVTATKAIAETVMWLDSEGMIVIDNSPGFPWSNVSLTEKGKAYLNETEASN